MNWLAHVFLSENHIEHQLGNLLTDPLKAKAWEGASMQVHRGIATHKCIDTFTDTHPIVSKSKVRLAKKGYLKGVVLDILYDHFLSLHWDKFSSIALDSFLADFHREAPLAVLSYPDRAKEVIGRVVTNKQLASYIHMDGVENALVRINKRLSPRALKKDTATRYLPIIKKEKMYLEEAFLDFFPELMSEVNQHLQSNNIEHWKKD